MRRWVWRILLAVAVMAALTVGASAAEVTTPDGIKLTDNGTEWTVTGYTGRNVKVEIPNTYEGKPVTAIGPKAFAGSSVTSVSIPENVISIGSEAFFGASLSALEIPGTVTTIGGSAFEQCRNLKTVKFLDVAGTGGGAAKTTIGPRAFAACGALNTLKLTGNVGSIGDGAFTSCGALSKVIIWEGTTNIGKDAFQLCNKLTQVVIPSSATAAPGAFSACQTLSVVHYAGDNPPAADALPAAIKPENIHKVAIDRSVGTATCTKGADVVEKVGCLTAGCSFRHEETQSLPALGHDLIETEVPDGKTHPDCETWIKTFEVTCSRAAACGYGKTTRLETVIGDETKHAWGAEKTEHTEAPTCSAEGLDTISRECTACGKVEELRTESVPKIPHTYTTKLTKPDEVKKAACEEDGLTVQYQICDKCDAVEACEDCEKLKEEAKKDPEKEADYLDHIKAEHTHAAIPAKGHTRSEPQYAVTKEPTCVADGEETWSVICTDCGEVLDTFPDDVDYPVKVIPKTGHTPTKKEADEALSKKATCLEDGYTVYKETKCTVCGTIFRPEREEIKASGEHTWKVFDEEIIKEATCTETGLKKVGARECTVCGEKEEATEEVIPLQPHEWADPEVTEKDENGNPVKNEDPNCGDPGVVHVIVHCKNCDKVEYQTLEIPATGTHTWGDWTVTKQPTATEAGEETRTCSTCNKKDTRPVSPTGTPTDPDDPDNPDEPGKPENSDYKVNLVQSSNGTFTASKSTAKQGEQITVTYTPDSGYVLDMIRVIGGSSLVSYTDLGGGRIRFTMPASDVEVRITFDREGADYSGSWGDGFGNDASGGRSDPRRTTDIVPGQITGHSVPKPDAYEQIFQDVPTGHWAAGEITWASDMGYMSGSGGRFNPDGNISHQQMWMVLARLTGASPANMEEARRWAVRGGYADGSSPTGAVKRHQLVTALYRCAGLTGGVSRANVTLSGYTDSRAVPARARDAFAWALTHGVVSADGEGRLNPAKNVTRAEFAAILYCYSQKL